MGDDKKRKKDEVKQKIDEFSRKKRRREHCIKRERERERNCSKKVSQNVRDNLMP